MFFSAFSGAPEVPASTLHWILSFHKLSLSLLLSGLANLSAASPLLSGLISSITCRTSSLD